MSEPGGLEAEVAWRAVRGGQEVAPRHALDDAIADRCDGESVGEREPVPRQRAGNLWLEKQITREQVAREGERAVRLAVGRDEGELRRVGDRVGVRGPGQMPQLSTSRIDETALQMLKEWVAAMR